MIAARTPRKHSREFKFQVVRLVASGEKSPSDVCRDYDLANSVLDRWRKEYDELGEEAFQPKRQWMLSRPVGIHQETQISSPARVECPREDRVAQLERLCGVLALENFLLKQQRAEHPIDAQLSLLR